MAYLFRMGTAKDAEAILNVTMEAFDIGPDNLRHPALRALCLSAPHECRVMEDEGGRIVAALHIGDTWIQVGQSAVLKGDVGHVAVLPSEQGGGLGTALMRDTVGWMRENGYHLSRLGGLTHFYSRFGYEPFPRRFTEFLVTQVHGGKGMVAATEAYPEPVCGPGVLRPFDEASDWQVRAALNDRFDRGRSGAALPARVVRAPVDPASPDPALLRFVYELDGEVKGVLFANDNPLETRPGESCYTITQFSYDPSCPQAAGLLLRLLMARIAPAAPARVVSRLPYDEPLGRALTAAEVPFRRIEMHEAIASNMILVLSLPAILGEVAEELTRRLSRSIVADFQGNIALSLPGQSVVLRLREGTVSVTEAEQAGIQVSLTQAEFVRLLFGLCSFSELHGLEDSPLGVRETAVMDALFPRCPTGTGTWG